MTNRTSRYSHLRVPGLPGVFFRDLELPLHGRTLQVYAASTVDVLEARQPNTSPYWSAAWPAGTALARYASEQNWAGLRVLEVGCGVGIAGLGAALAGAEVTATDLEFSALRIARMNARRNDLPLRLFAADWRAWPLHERFDVVLGGDVTYEPPVFSALLEVLEQRLKPGGEILLTDPGRLAASAFHQRALAERWTWRTHPLPKVGRQPVSLHRLTRETCSPHADRFPPPSLSGE